MERVQCGRARALDARIRFGLVERRRSWHRHARARAVRYLWGAAAREVFAPAGSARPTIARHRFGRAVPGSLARFAAHLSARTRDPRARESGSLVSEVAGSR